MSNDEIVAALARFPNGVCTAEFAREMGVDPRTIASRMSKLYYYGKIGRGLPLDRARGYAAMWKPKVMP